MVSAKLASSGVGKSSGSRTVVREETPAGTSGNPSLSWMAAASAWSRRVGARGPAAAAIERETSNTKIAWVSARTGWPSERTGAGPEAANASKSGTATTLASSIPFGRSGEERPRSSRIRLWRRDRH